MAVRTFSVEMSTKGWGREGETGMAEGFFLRSMVLQDVRWFKESEVGMLLVSLRTTPSKRTAFVACVGSETGNVVGS